MSTKNNKHGGNPGAAQVQTVTVDTHRDGQRLDNFLMARLRGVPKSVVYRVIRKGQVRINGKRCKPASRLQEGDLVRIPPVRIAGRDEVSVPDRAVKLLQDRQLYEDADMLVINKPSGMAVHAGSGLPWGIIDALRQARPGEYIELAHRLDRETSGCMVLARNGAALKHLADQFRKGEVEKKYLCLLDGVLKEAVMTVDAPLARLQYGERRKVQAQADGKPATTRFRLLRAFEGCSYAEAELLTGRTHQIRAHSRVLGLALAGDELYADRAALKVWRSLGLKRLFLHSHRLGLNHPDGREMQFDAPLPERLRLILDKLEDGSISYGTG